MAFNDSKKIEDLSLAEIKAQLGTEISVKEYASEIFEKASKLSDKFFTLKDFNSDHLSLSEKPLSSIPYVVADDICTKGVRTTCGSKMLNTFVPAYDSAIGEKLDSDLLVGKSAVLEFSCGESTEAEFSKKADKERCAAAEIVSAGGAGFAVATDGNAVRAQAAKVGAVAMKPTYGAISRFGLVGLGSSLGSAVPITRKVIDNAFVYAGLAGYDERDAMSAEEVKDFNGEAFYAEVLGGIEVSAVKMAYPKSFIDRYITAEEAEHFSAFIEDIKSLGAQVFEVEIENIETALLAHYILESAEGSTNLARFDGVHFGFRSKNYSDLNSLYKNTRGEGFGSEVKRRILAGNHFLTGSNYKEYYEKALKVRATLKKSVRAVLEKYDIIIMPNFAKGAGGSLIAANERDRFLAVASILGMPSLALPYSCAGDVCFGAQIIGGFFEEKLVYQVGSAIEEKIGKGGRK